jgi:hypothetical protein
MFWEDEGNKRKPFSTKTKKIEWMLASGRRVYDKSGKLRFVKTSKCRVCGTPLKWGERTYEFDHKDNNPANNTQTNCYLVCRNCHGKHTVVKKRKVKGIFGETVGYKTIKKKVGYKKPKKKPKKTKRVAIRGFFGDVIGYRTVKVRKPKTKKTTSRKATKPKRTIKKKKITRKRTKSKTAKAKGKTKTKKKKSRTKR